MNSAIARLHELRRNHDQLRRSNHLDWDNLDILRGIKGDRPQEYLVSRLRELGIAA